MNRVDGLAFWLGSAEIARGILVFVFVGVHAFNTWVPALKNRIMPSVAVRVALYILLPCTPWKKTFNPKFF